MLDYLFPYPIRSISWHPRQQTLAVSSVRISLLYGQDVELNAYLKVIVRLILQVGERAAVVIYAGSNEQ